MQSTNITAQDPPLTSTSTSSPSSSSSSSTSLDCNNVSREHAEHSLKRVREEESSGGEAVGGESRVIGSEGNIEGNRENRESNAEGGEGEGGGEGVDHSNNSLLTGTFKCTYIIYATLHFLKYPFFFLFFPPLLFVNNLLCLFV